MRWWLSSTRPVLEPRLSRIETLRYPLTAAGEGRNIVYRFPDPPARRAKGLHRGATDLQPGTRLEYQHYQYSEEQEYVRAFDYYSLGLVLLNIRLWKLLPD